MAVSCCDRGATHATLVLRRVNDRSMLLQYFLQRRVETMDTEPPMSLHDLHGHPTQPPPHQATNMLQNEAEVIRLAGRQAIVQFLEQHNCFAVLRNSGKVVVFDTRIPIQLAFYALVEHGA